MAYEELPHPTKNFRITDLFTQRGKNVALPTRKELLRLVGNTSIVNFFRHGILIESQEEAERLERERTSGPEYDFAGTTHEELFADLDELMGRPRNQY